MTRWLVQITVVVHLIIALGAHWTVLQTAAWVGMIIDYSESAPLMTALKKTFDGEHPCQMCVSIQDGKQTERAQDIKKAPHTTDWCCPVAGREWYPLILEPLAVRALTWQNQASGPPPASPPRLA